MYTRAAETREPAEESCLAATTIRRLLAWSAPLAVAAPLLAIQAWVRDDGRLSEAVSLLTLGEAAAGGEILAGLADSPGYRARARAGLRVAAALGARVPVAADEDPVDASPFPLALLARQAFEAGRFEAALELAGLAPELGQPPVPLIATAARIELGGDLRGNGAGGAPASNRLARSVRDYLASPAVEVILRDRGGVDLGRLATDGELTLAPGVRPELVPRAAARAAADRHAPSLRLSLDLELSEGALAALGRYRGSIVVLDAASGEVLAAVSDPWTFDEGGTPAFEQRREPASISKIITATAALRAGIDPDAAFAEKSCHGHQRYDGQILYCPYVAGALGGLDRAMAVSCNVAFADLGVDVGRRRLVEELRRYGFDGSLGGYPAGRILEPWGDERQLADLAIGLEATDVTPLHAALLAAVLANDGVMPEPSLLHAEDGRLGFHPRLLPPAPGRPVLEAAWLPRILWAMEAVVDNGTASGVAPRSFPVAMKTGTASDPRSGFHVNYVGVGPMPDPRVAFCVRITHQKTSRRVRDAAREVTRRLLLRLARAAGSRSWPADPAPSTPERLLAQRQREGGDRT
jgi:peptidoglycan glycosyltransferase